MKLYGKVTHKNAYGDPFVTNDKEYEVFKESYSEYSIIDDSECENNLSRDADNEAYYGKWFSLIPPSVHHPTLNEGSVALEDIIVELKSINHSLESYKLEVIIDDLVVMNKLNK